MQNNHFKEISKNILIKNMQISYAPYCIYMPQLYIFASHKKGDNENIIQLAKGVFKN